MLSALQANAQPGRRRLPDRAENTPQSKDIGPKSWWPSAPTKAARRDWIIATRLALKLGEVVEFLVPHCDPTINLYDRYHCVRGDRLVEIWPIDGRGR